MLAVFHHQNFLLDDCKVISYTVLLVRRQKVSNVKCALFTWLKFNHFDSGPLICGQPFGLNKEKVAKSISHRNEVTDILGQQQNNLKGSECSQGTL